MKRSLGTKHYFNKVMLPYYISVTKYAGDISLV